MGSLPAFVRYYLLNLLSVFLALPVSASATLVYASESPLVLAQNNIPSVCTEPILSRLRTHRVASGETIESIASSYNLLPTTLVYLNSLEGQTVSVGSELSIPPLNGIRIQVPNGATWKDLEGAYGVRADVLFELNGCQEIPDFVFIPGVQWTGATEQVDNYSGLAGYPLPNLAAVGLSYGWHTVENQSRFHSGLDLLVATGTPVMAVDAGTVAFAGQHGAYGNLVVINHSGGRQTRYAHLETIAVLPGEAIEMGNPVGSVGITGRRDLEAPHLHFEVRYNSPAGWVAQDPEIHLQSRSGN